MDVLNAFKKSILANGGNIFEVNCFHSFSQTTYSRKIQVNIVEEASSFLIELMRGAAVFSMGNQNLKTFFHMSVFPHV